MVKGWAFSAAMMMTEIINARIVFDELIHHRTCGQFIHKRK